MISWEATKFPRPRSNVVKVSLTVGAQPAGVVETGITPMPGGMRATTPVASGNVFKNVGTGDTVTVSAWLLLHVLCTVTPAGFPPAKYAKAPSARKLTSLTGAVSVRACNASSGEYT